MDLERGEQPEDLNALVDPGFMDKIDHILAMRKGGIDPVEAARKIIKAEIRGRKKQRRREGGA